MNRANYVESIRAESETWSSSLEFLEGRIVGLPEAQRTSAERDLDELRGKTEDINQKITIPGIDELDEEAWEGLRLAVDDACEGVRAIIRKLKNAVANL